MNWTYEERRHRERNYRWMFRAALALLAVGTLLAFVGLIAMISEANTFLFGIGLIVAALAGMSAYLSVRSTAEIIDADVRDSCGS